ncbi:hypothetical protein HX787_27470 [Pseudomonas tolaasii]|uniref:Uncharacterized protein n=2 Tax=Pseudomonas tolaasii TaxID=29442 RepID=A0A7Y8DSC7_PSETO|nr:hypothetical protein [Pseudomonas tolaasii]ARB27261.1 hypothetical protein B5P22_08230 [Pseudomonas tolaasii]KAB0466769.1 hypothetical protein F7R12_27385 [Pseudomonas tolaasii]MBY8942455.1 hypothetical protein [Pseudomonas tolaasii]NWC24101.1 hypothetical protein [Pseudomonas tolaasii]NWC37769.1 hypothetical protein [Pseudomonas tolaasii]
MPTENKTIGQQRLDRVIAANEFLRVIANCGRCFFRNKGAGHDAYLALNGRRNIVWLFDDYTGDRINVTRQGPWDGFSHGGTLKSLVGSIGSFVLSGKMMLYGYFQPVMDNGFENPWGYGDDILIVRDEGVRLGLIRKPEDRKEAA